MPPQPFESARREGAAASRYMRGPPPSAWRRHAALLGTARHGRHAARNGYTLPQIADISGLTPDHITSVIKHYLALNNQLADAAIGKLTAWMHREGIAL